MKTSIFFMKYRGQSRLPDLHHLTLFQHTNVLMLMTMMQIRRMRVTVPH
jgi:hypothetical protein